jgi:hypothetical protein
MAINYTIEAAYEMLLQTEAAATMSERERIVALIDSEMADWNKYKTIPRISGIRSKGAVDALSLLRELITGKE